MADFPAGTIPLSLEDRTAGLWSRWTAWMGKGFMAVLDQGLISGSNFAIAILLARWLGEEQYGAYALAFAIFLLLANAYQALVLEPMCVFGPSNYRNSLREYLGALIWIHLAIAFVPGVVLGLAALVTHLIAPASSLTGALLGVMLASPCILLFWLARRAFYLELRPAQAAGGAVFYCMSLMAGLWLVVPRGALTPFRAFLIMAIGALATAAFQLYQLKPIMRLRQSPVAVATVVRQHWTYGRWALASSAMMWVPWNIYYMLVGGLEGMSGTGELRALLNLAMPIRQTTTAFSLLALPYAAGLGHREGWAGIKAVVIKTTFLFSAGAIAYWAFVTMFRVPVVHFLYKGNYSGITSYVPWIALASVFMTALQGPAVVLRARRSPASVFMVYLVASIIAVVIGIPATWLFGIRGAVSTLVVSNVVGFGATLLLLHWNLREPVRENE
jgi:O-antigen/teichoic acid export membrane protein